MAQASLHIEFSDFLSFIALVVAILSIYYSYLQLAQSRKERRGDILPLFRIQDKNSSSIDSTIYPTYTHNGEIEIRLVNDGGKCILENVIYYNHDYVKKIEREIKNTYVNTSETVKLKVSVNSVNEYQTLPDLTIIILFRNIDFELYYQEFIIPSHISNLKVKTAKVPLRFVKIYFDRIKSEFKCYELPRIGIEFSQD